MATESASPHSRFTERTETFVTTAASATRWAARTWMNLARQVPGAAAVEAEWSRLERAALVELRRRLDNVDPLGHVRPEFAAEPFPEVAGFPKPVVTTPPKQSEPLRVAMAELLLRSMEQTAQRAREYLYLAVLRQLLPDEARILAALADGSAYPVVHVDCRTGVSGSERLLSNASTVGRAAGVAALPAVPRYVTRLLRLDLVELGDADPALSVPYDILLTDAEVRAAEEQARASGRVRIVRNTVAMSPLGRELWDACHPREDVAASWPTDADTAGPAGFDSAHPAPPARPALDGPLPVPLPTEHSRASAPARNGSTPTVR